MGSGIKGYEINTPTSTLVFKALANGKGAGFTDGFFETLEITAKSISFGDGSVTIDDHFAGWSGSSKTIPAYFSNLKSGSKLNADVIINSDGILASVVILEEQEDTTVITTISKNLIVNQGGIAAGSQIEGKEGVIEVGGRATLKDVNIATFMPESGVIGNITILKAYGGVDLQGVKSASAFTWAQAGDLVSGLKSIVGTDKKTAAEDGGLTYKLTAYTLEAKVDGNALIVTPKLTEEAKNQDIKTLVNTEKNKTIQYFYDDWKDKATVEDCIDPDKCSNTFTRAQRDEVKEILGNYLRTQNIDPDTGKPLSSTFVLKSANVLANSVQKSTEIVADGAIDIDRKLDLLTNKDNADITEAIKNSSNDLLAVNFVARSAQAYNNLPLQLVDEVKSSIKQTASSANLAFLQENLGVKMAVTQRLMGYKPISLSKVEKQDEENKEAIEVVQIANVRNLWVNTYGGSMIVGSNVGGLGGVSVGFDDSKENAIIGGYLAYTYNYAKDDLLKLDAQSIEAGFYTRMDFNSHQIDVNLKTQANFINQERETKIYASSTKANYFNSYSALEVRYGYNFGSESFFTKPFIGARVGYSMTPSYKDSGDIILDFEAQNNVIGTLSLGVELRKFFDKSGFLYVIPSIEQGVFGLQDSLKFKGATNISNALEIDNRVKTYAQLLIGGEIRVSNAWNIGLGMALKQIITGLQDDNQEWKNQTYITGNISGIYKF